MTAGRTLEASDSTRRGADHQREQNGPSLTPGHPALPSPQAWGPSRRRAVLLAWARFFLHGRPRPCAPKPLGHGHAAAPRVRCGPRSLRPRFPWPHAARGVPPPDNAQGRRQRRAPETTGSFLLLFLSNDISPNITCGGSWGGGGLFEPRTSCLQLFGVQTGGRQGTFRHTGKSHSHTATGPMTENRLAGHTAHCGGVKKTTSLPPAEFLQLGQ